METKVKDDDFYRFYDAHALIERGIFNDPAELWRARKFKDFPQAVKTASTYQAKARFRVSEVHAWLDKMAGQHRAVSYRKGDPSPPKRKAGRPPKVRKSETIAESVG